MKASLSSTTHHSAKKFVLRLPPNVHEKIFLTAKQHRRSMNAEIIHHLEKTLPLSLANETQPEFMLDEEHCLSLLRALPTHKRTAIFALIESLNV